MWGSDSAIYGTRESSTKVTVFHKFEEHKSFRPSFPAEGIFGGTLLGVRSQNFIDFYDWDSCQIVRRIEVCPQHVYWSEGGEVVVLACENNAFFLRYNQPLVQKYLTSGTDMGEEGVDRAFSLEAQISDSIVTGHFVGECFVYTTSSGRLNYHIGGQTITLAHLDKPGYLLGYIRKHNKVYLMDQQFNIISYSLLFQVLVYQTAIVREDFEAGMLLLLSLLTRYCLFSIFYLFIFFILFIFFLHTQLKLPSRRFLKISIIKLLDSLNHKVIII